MVAGRSHSIEWYPGNALLPRHVVPPSSQLPCHVHFQWAATALRPTKITLGDEIAWTDHQRSECIRKEPAFSMDSEGGHAQEGEEASERQLDA